MQPDALIPRSKEWWSGTSAIWHSTEKRWTFPSGATLTFGYLERDDDVYQYQGAAYHFIGIDELTQHTEFRYRYLFSRQRRLKGVDVPIRMRAATNPGGRGHEWVKKRFITERQPGRIFVPALLKDNPSLDADDYIASLAELDPITRAQLLSGDWDAYHGGRFDQAWFKRRWKMLASGSGFQIGDRRHEWAACRKFVTVDAAASVKTSADYTVISVWAVTPDHNLVMADCYRNRWEVPDIVPEMERVWALHRPLYVGVEGLQLYQLAKRTKMIVKELKPAGLDKLKRATKAIVLAESGRVWLPEHQGCWGRGAASVEDVLGELVRFTGDEKRDAYDDVVDTASYAAELIDGLGVAEAASKYRPVGVGR